MQQTTVKYNKAQRGKTYTQKYVGNDMTTIIMMTMTLKK